MRHLRRMVPPLGIATGSEGGRVVAGGSVALRWTKTRSFNVAAGEGPGGPSSDISTCQSGGVEDAPVAGESGTSSTRFLLSSGPAILLGRSHTTFGSSPAAHILTVKWLRPILW